MYDPHGPSKPKLSRDERLAVYGIAVREATGRREKTQSNWHYYDICPFCKDQRRQISAAHATRGFRCFKCGWHDAEEIMAALGITDFQIARWTPPAPRDDRDQAPPRRWQANPQAYQDRFLGHLDRIRLWQAYKPLSLESISRFQLGVGVVPSVECRHPRLIYANLESGAPAGFRGRRLKCDCPQKWVTAAGSGIWLAGAHLLRPGAKVLRVENWIDAILCMQRWPGCVAVASTGGAEGWTRAMLDQIIASQPAGVKDLGDNDHACLPNAETIEYIRTVINPERQQRGKKPLRISGAWRRHADYMRAAGVRVTHHIWPPGTPYKYDPGQMLIDEGCL